jgi:chromosome partitioning protein
VWPGRSTVAACEVAWLDWSVNHFQGRKGPGVRTIAIINQKGGCGKTTCSINLAASLAAKGKRTLLVDMDPQSHCAMGLAVPDAQIEKSIADMLRVGLDGSLAMSEVTWQIARHFDLAPSSITLAGMEAQLTTAPDKDRRLVQVLSTVQDNYDFCIVDCPPSIGLLTFNALRAADEVMIPVETGFFSMQGAVRQQQTIEMLARRAAHHVRFKVLATMYDVRTKLAREILAELKRHFGKELLPIVINFNSKLKEAASFGQPITEYDAASRGMQDFERLTEWLLANPPEPATTMVEQYPSDQVVVTGAASNPAMSRAAELVERARALSTRTAELSSRMAGDKDAQLEGFTSPAPPRPIEQPQEPAIVTPPDSFEKKLAGLFGARNTAQGLLFIQPNGKACDLAIAGDFNGWNPATTPLRHDESLGVWQTCVDVPPGRYRYRLVVDGQWVQDPYNSYVESNPFGELNNIVVVQ